MAKFTIDGLTYTDKLPHSRIERILYDILKKEGGGGGGDDDALVIDGPEDLGNGLKLADDKISLDISNKVDLNVNTPVTSNAVYEQLEVVDTIMQKI